eukprot:gene11-155_t
MWSPSVLRAVSFPVLAIVTIVLDVCLTPVRAASLDVVATLRLPEASMARALGRESSGPSPDRRVFLDLGFSPPYSGLAEADADSSDVLVRARPWTLFMSSGSEETGGRLAEGDLGTILATGSWFLSDDAEVHFHFAQGSVDRQLRVESTEELIRGPEAFDADEEHFGLRFEPGVATLFHEMLTTAGLWVPSADMSAGTYGLSDGAAPFQVMTVVSDFLHPGPWAAWSPARGGFREDCARGARPSRQNRRRGALYLLRQQQRRGAARAAMSRWQGWRAAQAVATGAPNVRALPDLRGSGTDHPSFLRDPSESAEDRPPCLQVPRLASDVSTESSTSSSVTRSSSFRSDTSGTSGSELLWGPVPVTQLHSATDPRDAAGWHALRVLRIVLPRGPSSPVAVDTEGVFRLGSRSVIALVSARYAGQNSLRAEGTRSDVDTKSETSTRDSELDGFGRADEPWELDYAPSGDVIPSHSIQSAPLQGNNGPPAHLLEPTEAPATG